MVKYIADSSCDIQKLENENFESVPLLIYTDEWKYLDDGSIDISEMLDKLEKYNGRSYTSCPTVESWISAFEGAGEIYVVTITSGLSGTYNSALIAKDIYLDSHPDAKIEVFDSLSTGPEMKMALEKIMELKKEGHTFEEVCTLTHKYLDDVRLFFVLSSIHNLAQNGRVSKVIASAVGILGISIIGIASEIGIIKQISRARGDRHVIKTLMEQFSSVGYNGGKISICNVQNINLAEKLASAIRSKFENADISIYPAGGLCSYYAERNGIIIGIET